MAETEQERAPQPRTPRQPARRKSASRAAFAAGRTERLLYTCLQKQLQAIPENEASKYAFDLKLQIDAEVNAAVLDRCHQYMQGNGELVGVIRTRWREMYQKQPTKLTPDAIDQGVVAVLTRVLKQRFKTLKAKYRSEQAVVVAAPADKARVEQENRARTQAVTQRRKLWHNFSDRITLNRVAIRDADHARLIEICQTKYLPELRAVPNASNQWTYHWTPGLLSEKAKDLIRYLFVLPRPPGGVGSKAIYTEGLDAAKIPPIAKGRQHLLAPWALASADDHEDEDEHELVTNDHEEKDVTAPESSSSGNSIPEEIEPVAAPALGSTPIASHEESKEEKRGPQTKAAGTDESLPAVTSALDTTTSASTSPTRSLSCSSSSSTVSSLSLTSLPAKPAATPPSRKRPRPSLSHEKAVTDAELERRARMARESQARAEQKQQEDEEGERSKKRMLEAYQAGRRRTRNKIAAAASSASS